MRRSIPEEKPARIPDYQHPAHRARPTRVAVQHEPLHCRRVWPPSRYLATPSIRWIVSLSHDRPSRTKKLIFLNLFGRCLCNFAIISVIPWIFLRSIRFTACPLNFRVIALIIWKMVFFKQNQTLKNVIFTTLWHTTHWNFAHTCISSPCNLWHPFGMILTHPHETVVYFSSNYIQLNTGDTLIWQIYAYTCVGSRFNL